MNIVQDIQNAFIPFIATTFNVSNLEADKYALQLNVDPNKQQFGDLNSNVAMVLAGPLKQNPRALAQQIADNFKHPLVTKIEVAGPGFLNFYITPAALQTLAQQLVQQKETFFKLAPSVPKKHYSIEFVSANPTGPLHLGHGRGGIIGDVLANVLNFIGHTAIREYYINDAGSQIEKLGRSFKARCEQLCGIATRVPEDGYQGEYLLDLAKKCVDEYGQDIILKEPDTFFADYAREELLDLIKTTLDDYGIHFNVWFSEKSLHDSGAILHALDVLEKNGHLYEQEGALWFKSTAFGDDKDRVLRKQDGSLTYVAADIAYMQNKRDRGSEHLIMILGHDHHSYVQRLQGLLQALKLNATLDVILYQLVKMKAEGEQVRMSKRAGNIVTLQDVIETVGTDVARFFYLHRKADAQLEFDLDLALKKTDENPVYYVQYAYVRIKSIVAKAQQEAALNKITLDGALHIGPEEALLLKKIASLKDVLATISTNYQTHVLAYYIIELAQTFHGYYSQNRVIDLDNVPKSRARLLVLNILEHTFETALTLLGLSKPDRM